MNSKKLFSDLVQKTTLTESVDEIQQLVFRVLEHELGLSTTEILMEKEVEISTETLTRINDIVERLNRNEPIQYIFGEAEFLGRKFLVNASVLIPRPETEELVKLVPHPAAPYPTGPNEINIIDIGTGSGCIAITLKAFMPQANVYATDISEDALAIARQNVERLEPEVQLIKHDILQEDIPVTAVDIVVSNPPYIAHYEKQAMQQNVVAYEPHVALFVQDDDPLQFYKAIALRAKKVLKPGGKVLVEINERLGEDTAKVFEAEGYSDISIIKDISNKDRIVTATWNPS
jgi:release factor glutamine methyltransferase